MQKVSSAQTLQISQGDADPEHRSGFERPNNPGGSVLQVSSFGSKDCTPGGARVLQLSGRNCARFACPINGNGGLDISPTRKLSF